MWYAIEYAYGARVVNNGTRADRVVEFTAKRLRDVWVAQTSGQSMDSAGYRDVASARHPLVRKADWKDSGDNEAWRILAEQRVSQSPALSQYRGTIFADWSDPNYRYVATAKEPELLSWAKATHEAAAEIEG